MAKHSNVSLDSQCLSYLIDAMADIREPTDALAPQRLALFRSYLYRPGGLVTTPTVMVECRRIRDAARAEFHESWIHTLFGEAQPIDPAQIDARTTQLLDFHSDPDDCQILAETEDAGLTTLLSFDFDFISHLADKTTVNLLRPNDFWQSLKIPRGAHPVNVPHHTNPLAQVSWWRW